MVRFTHKGIKNGKQKKYFLLSSTRQLSIDTIFRCTFCYLRFPVLLWAVCYTFPRYMDGLCIGTIP